MFLFPVVVFAQQPWYKYSQFDNTWQNVGNEGFSARGGVSYTSLAFNPINSLPYVAYMDWGNSQKATVMMFNGTNWVNVGNAGFSAGEAFFTSLAFSLSNGQPYVAYSDNGNSSKATVMKFDGTNWMNVGNAGFSAGMAWYTSLAFSPSDSLPYVAFEDGGNVGKATVMKFDGTNWVYVGAEDFSIGAASYESIAFSPSGQPYVAFDNDILFTGGAIVMNFDGTNWVNVGVDTLRFSASSTSYTSLAFNPSNNQPYVAYSDNQFLPHGHGRATVMKFDGTNWVNVGDSGFSTAEADYTSLAFSQSGQPFVAFVDWGDSSKATVMRFDGSKWVDVGSAGFSAGRACYTSLVFSPNDQPYVAYMDGADSSKATVMYYDSVFVGVKEQQESKLSLYPNPATDKITIEIAEGQVPSQLSMMNLNGQDILTCQITKSKSTIDISGLPSGVYFMRVTNERTVEVGKFIKN